VIGVRVPDPGAAPKSFPRVPSIRFHTNQVLLLIKVYTEPFFQINAGQSVSNETLLQHPKSAFNDPF